MSTEERTVAAPSLRSVLPLLLAWAACVGVACLGLAWAERSGRDALTARFAARSDARAELISSYVDEVFSREERLADDLASGDVPLEMFAEATHLLGFDAALLLDREGRALATAPVAPELVGQDLAPRYDHLASALEGDRAVSGAVEYAVLDEPVVAFALPVEDGEAAVISAGFTLSRSPLQTLLGEVALPGARGNLVDAAGTPIVDTEAPTYDPDVVEAARRDPVAVGGRVVTATSVAGTGWTYLIDVDEDVLYAPTSQDDAFWWTGLGVVALGALVAIVQGVRINASRRRATELRREADRRLALTMRNAPIGMAIVDLDRRFVDPNPRFCAMLGYPCEELQGLSLDKVTHPDDLDRDVSQVELLERGDIDSFEIPKRYVRKDGSQFWGLLSVSVVRDDDGRPRHYVRQIQDVTDSVERMAELERFAGVVAHDLKNPVAVVRSWTDILEEELSETLGPEGADPFLDGTRRIQAAALTMTQLIDDLLAFTAPGSSTNLERSDVDLDAVVDEVVAAMSTDAGSGPLVEHQALGTVHGNPRLVRQLVANLIGNAVKYVPDGVRPHVVVVTRDRGGVVELRVTDNGIGIPEDRRDRVFEPFYRSEGAAAYAGTGLGLAICHRAMQVHGGSIRVEDAPGGNGTAFVCTFPSTGGRQDAPRDPDVSRGRAAGPGVPSRP